MGFIPKPGEIVVVAELPECNFCNDGTPGIYDFATSIGPWANGCQEHFDEYHRYDSLGVGKAQRLITRFEISEDAPNTPEMRNLRRGV